MASSSKRASSTKSIERRLTQDQAACVRGEAHLLASLLFRHTSAKIQGKYISNLRIDEPVLAPLIAWAQKPGVKSLLANQMRRWGYNVTRDMVRAWLHPEELRRREPSFNYGLLLIAAAVRLWPAHDKKQKIKRSKKP